MVKLWTDEHSQCCWPFKTIPRPRNGSLSCQFQIVCLEFRPLSINYVENASALEAGGWKPKRGNFEAVQCRMVNASTSKSDAMKGQVSSPTGANMTQQPNTSNFQQTLIVFFLLAVALEHLHRVADKKHFFSDSHWQVGRDELCLQNQLPAAARSLVFVQSLSEQTRTCCELPGRFVA